MKKYKSEMILIIEKIKKSKLYFCIFIKRIIFKFSFCINIIYQSKS